MLTLILAAAALLLAAWLLGPVAAPPAGEPPEVRGGLAVLWWINRAYCAAMHGLVNENEAPLPEHGPAILVANHTCGVDNLLLQAGCRRVLGFLIAREFHDFWAIRPLSHLLGCIPVRRDGRDLAATRESLRVLEAGRVLPIFPEGRITPDSGRVIGPGKPGAAFLTARARVPVIPAYIRGTPPTNDVFRAMITPSHARVVYGPPVDLADLLAPAPDDSHDAERARQAEITARLMGAIEALRDQSLARDAAR